MLQKNQETEFLELIGKHQGIIHKVCSVYEHTVHARQDLFQEIIIQLWRNWHQYRGEANLSTWLYRVAINTAITFYRKQRKNMEAAADAYYKQALPDEAYKETEEQIQILYRTLHHLTHLERAIVLLYFDNKSYKEMEDVLGIKEGTLRVKMNRLKEKLRHLLTSQTYGT
ncbi:MAG: sigma-70 family RNA polymerase sigma factor [Bacteroidota bacterium]|nr:sigma-70 family RNA polymerase sigma factor [Bacteroidota bacterium]